ncbi:unnamed protein product [[Candida] boidinii]|uniref:Unnamed protein product n=1 Tax=Candida boidinii TaxID=5477 RepID=A0A9W6SU73_CANBO|nr:hypothetical protein B5S30_g933 [[Candida] boidinii]OWB81658.1 hypothetical protein B5S33_g277 [[Candida] boidinii]GME67308.1 unnamed protein product [[Candida] boidinii]GMF45447.1 unnamed protein product [[Candida] boidinii]GMF98433.1 unnamed protein product [[Candida] boidinii]
MRYPNSFIILLSLFFGCFVKFGLTADEAEIWALTNDLALLDRFFKDFDDNYDYYTSYMNANKMEFPQEVVQFYMYLESVTNDEMITSLADQYPFTEIYTFATAFPQYSSFLQDVGMTKYLFPSDFTSVSNSILPASSTEILSATSDEVTSTSVILITSEPPSSSSYVSSVIASASETSVSSANDALRNDRGGFYLLFLLLTLVCIL